MKKIILKKGQAFIGIDDCKYYFLGYDCNNQIMFTTVELWVDYESKYIVKNNLFIKEILKEFNPIIEKATWYYQSKEELENEFPTARIQRCLDIINNENNSKIELKPLRIISYSKGQAYSKKHNQYYEVIGFVIENNVYLNKKFCSKETGFFSIYHSNCKEDVPMIFERSISFNTFIAGNSDKVDIKKEIMDEKLVNSYITREMKKELKNFEKIN